MKEYECPVHGKHKIRFAGELGIMNPVPKSISVKRAPQDQLGLGILAANSGHHAGSGLLVYDINHWHSSCFDGYVRNGSGL
jgi:hypothetical protein